MNEIDPMVAEYAYVEPFRAFIEFLEEADKALEVSIRCIAGTEGLGRLAEIVRRRRRTEGKYHDPLSEEDAKQVDYARKLEDLAHQQVREGFPLLYAHSVVAIWGALEATIPSFVTQWLLCRPDALTKPIFEKIRVSVATYESLSQEEKMRYVVDELLRSIQYQTQPGVGRFEALLNPLGLGVRLTTKSAKTCTRCLRCGT